ncbi:amino acid ABC transporter substrate-binding protein [Rhizobium rhizoryzae]|jgi:glutamate/aspartate transport system substrate-binding protein|uniref:Glutamate/aspartate transport system substrate-binding protein n=1 Tax=Rhizobium rhizoryzae TaxID=451876 RepID=A0A7W6PTV8_9HYPH|nr:amino acid ABC transporter substrate-binding protein [Rhizobium rhizoryzae]MBB4145185.1 glutamate/aspartate transport system substrate-binding protein [Rhizobium rhizoryzae]
MLKILFQRLLAAILLLLPSTLALAETDLSFNGSTIERLKETRVLRVGYGSAQPFSFKTSSGEVVGYSIDLCRAMARKMQAMLDLPELSVELVQRTPANRIQLLNDGGIDIECNASTNVADRRKAVFFTPPHFIAQTKVVSLARNNINRIDDLRGKSVAVVLGTVNVSQILQLSRERKLGLVSVPVNEVREAFELVKSGRVSAFAMDDVLIRNLIAQTGNPDDYVVSSEAISEPQPYGFMTRINDPQFAELAATALRSIYRSPQMQEMYDRWFMQPFEGSPQGLNLPISDELKASFATQ